MDGLEKNLELLNKLALKHYPVNITWSMGESYDVNEYKREAFIQGFLLALELSGR
jgi:hypothetical protein